MLTSKIKFKSFPAKPSKFHPNFNYFYGHVGYKGKTIDYPGILKNFKVNKSDHLIY